MLHEQAKIIRLSDGQSLSSIANAFTKVGLGTYALFQAIETQLLSDEARIIRSFNEQDLSNTLSAFSRSGVGSPLLYSALVAQIKTFKMSELSTFAICTLSISLVIAQAPNNDLLKQLLDELIRRQPTALALENIMNLSQLVLALRYEARFTPQITKQLQTALQAILSKHTLPTKNNQISTLQKEVFIILSKLKPNLRQEYSIELFDVDIACPEEKWVVEVNGRSHYIPNTHELDGCTQFKMRLLEKMGYKVLTVPYWEWDNLSEEEEKESYLQILCQPVLKTQLDAKMLVMAAHFFGLRGIKNQELFATLQTEITSKLDELKPTYFAVVVNAFAKSGFGTTALSLYSACETKLLSDNGRRLQDLDAHAIENLKNAFAKACYQSSALAQAINNRSKT